MLRTGKRKVSGNPVVAAAATPAASAPPQSAPAPSRRRAACTDTTPPRHSAWDTLPQYPFLKIAGFADVDFSATNLHGANGGFGAQTLLNPHSGFEEGQFVLHFTSALSSKVTVFSEFSMTARSDAGTGTPPATGFNVEVERLMIRYDLNDYFKLSFGRYHTPINYWNTAFHHGAWLQTTISRPEMTQFGGSFLPVHFVGALVEGSAPANGWNLNYNVGVGNGRSTVISRDGDFGDINNSRATLVNVFVRPQFLFGLQMRRLLLSRSAKPGHRACRGGMDPVRPPSMGQGNARIHCRIRECHTQTERRRSHLQQPGGLCSNRLSVALEAKAVEAVLSLRIYPRSFVRPYFPQSGADLFRFHGRHSLRHLQLRRIQSRIPQLRTSCVTLNSWGVSPDELHVLRQIP